MQPRIYTYKVTFKGAPFWYWGVHKEGKYGECYFGTPVTHKWAWEFYEPEIQILELFPYTDEGWEEACQVEKRLIRPDLNKAECLNGSCGGYFSLEVSRKAGKKGAAVLKAKLTKEERRENGAKGAAATNAEKDEDGKSVNARKGSAAANAEKDEDGKSVNAKKAGAASKLVRQKKVELTRISDGVTFVFDSGWDAARDLDLDQSTLSRVCNGKRKSTKGYTARYLP